MLVLFVNELGQVRFKLWVLNQSLWFKGNYDSQFSLFNQMCTDQFDKIDDEIIQLNWYSFPNEIQRILPAVMLSTQQSAVIKCFGNVLCARVQVKKVCFVFLLPNFCLFNINVNQNFGISFQIANVVYSYFMVLRKFYQWFWSYFRSLSYRCNCNHIKS